MCIRDRAGFERSQTGVALITVLLIVFLASVTATSLAALQQIAIRRSTVLQHQQQARLYTLAIEQWAVLVLARDSQQNETDHLHEEWANASSALPVTEGVLSAQLRDLQGCFNLNNLWPVSYPHLDVYKRQPLLRPARRLLPPISGVDLSPMVVIVALIFISLLLQDFLGFWLGAR